MPLRPDSPVEGSYRSLRGRSARGGRRCRRGQTKTVSIVVSLRGPRFRSSPSTGRSSATDNADFLPDLPRPADPSPGRRGSCSPIPWPRPKSDRARNYVFRRCRAAALFIATPFRLIMIGGALAPRPSMATRPINQCHRKLGLSRRSPRMARPNRIALTGMSSVTNEMFVPPRSQPRGRK